MLRAIVTVLSLGLLVTLLTGTADSAPGGRGVRATAGRAGGGVRNAVPGPGAGGPRSPSGPASNRNSFHPTGPISAGGVRPNSAATGVSSLPQAGDMRFPGQQRGNLNVRDQFPSGSQLPGQGPGQWQSQLSNAQNTIQGQLNQAATAYGVNAGGPAPFSPAWYAQHPNAWHITHPYAGEAAVAVTAIGLASFMAIEAGTVATGSTTIVYGSETTAGQTEAATELAAAGETAVDPDGPWMPVGVFALRPMDAPNATRMIQLAVNSQGALRGSHYDLLSEETADIVGAVDRNTTRVSWRIGENGRVVFDTDLAQLTQPQGLVRVQFPDGQAGQWSVTRLQQ